MRKMLSLTATGCLLAAALTGCSGSQHSEDTSFGFAGRTLHVTNPNHAMPVSVSSGGAGQVKVTVTTTSVGKDVTTPAWHLEGDTLDLGTPCSKGYVGVCEGSYHLDVPQGTTVQVNGQDVPVG